MIKEYQVNTLIMNYKNNSGFTLIELMVVVAIIGILAAVAIPAYSEYQSKAKVTAGLAEISGGKVAFELKLANSEGITLATDIGLASSTANCNITVSNTGITCLLTGAPPEVNNKTIVLNKLSSSDSWVCQAPAIDTKFKPKNC